MKIRGFVTEHNRTVRLYLIQIEELLKDRYMDEDIRKKYSLERERLYHGLKHGIIDKDDLMINAKNKLGKYEQKNLRQRLHAFVTSH